jgi:hypothetical protein
VGGDGGGGGDRDSASPPGDGGDGGCDYGCAVLKDNPLVYLRFNEPASASQAIDATGNGHPGVYPQAGASKTQGIFPGETAIAFAGSGPQAIAMPSFLDFTGTTGVAFSVEMWLKPDSVAGQQFVMDHERFDTRGGWLVYIDEGNLQVELWANGTDFAVGYTSNAPLKTNVWQHAVLTYNSADQRAFIWLDNTLLFSNVTGGGSLPAVGPWSIGKQNCSPCQDTNYRGAIDELAIYGYALNQATVGAHYDAAHAQMR